MLLMKCPWASRLNCPVTAMEIYIQTDNAGWCSRNVRLEIMFGCRQHAYNKVVEGISVDVVIWGELTMQGVYDMGSMNQPF